MLRSDAVTSMPETSRCVKHLLMCVVVTQAKLPGVTPDPITRLIGRRVLERRKEMGMSQTALGERMTERGSPWSRTSVAKLETGKRSGITVQELLALAQVFDVPPPLLLADPKTGLPVPVTPDREVAAWPALLWLLAAQPLDQESAHWMHGARPAVLGGQISQAVDQLVDEWNRRSVKAMLKPEDAPSEEETTKQDRRDLHGLSGLLSALAQYDTPPPPIPNAVISRAAQLAVKLPGVEA